MPGLPNDNNGNNDERRWMDMCCAGLTNREVVLYFFEAEIINISTVFDIAKYSDRWESIMRLLLTQLWNPLSREYTGMATVPRMVRDNFYYGDAVRVGCFSCGKNDFQEPSKWYWLQCTNCNNMEQYLCCERCWYRRLNGLNDPIENLIVFKNCSCAIRDTSEIIYKLENTEPVDLSLSN